MAIVVCPLSQAPAAVLRYRPSRAVSLLDPHTPFPTLGGLDPHNHLRVAMHDISSPQTGAIPPDERHVEAIISFVSDWRSDAPILIHCWAGISRSTATAFITACIHNPDTDEEEIALALRRASPTATPNPRLVALADATLGRGGRMRKAAAHIGQGKPSWGEILEADAFVLQSRFGHAG
jgi:predicted protein tyrosine phosphatase